MVWGKVIGGAEHNMSSNSPSNCCVHVACSNHTKYILGFADFSCDVEQSQALLYNHHIPQQPQITPLVSHTHEASSIHRPRYGVESRSSRPFVRSSTPLASCFPYARKPQRRLTSAKPVEP